MMLGYTCNNRCLFCYNDHKRDIPSKSFPEIISNVKEARKSGTGYLEIIGGEASIRPDIIEIIQFAKSLGFKIITMTTNGGMFYYKDFTKKILNAGLTRVVFSIHGHTARLHDMLTQTKGSFDRLVAAIQNVMDVGMKKNDIGSNTTIVKANYRHLYDIGDFVYRTGIRNAEFIFVDPTRGGALEYFDDLVPKISDAAPFIRSCLNIGKTHSIVHWHVRYVPVCYFRGYKDQISEINERKLFSRTEHIAPDFRNANVEKSREKIGRIKPLKCKSCKDRGICEGLWLQYYKIYGDQELLPA